MTLVKGSSDAPSRDATHLLRTMVLERPSRHKGAEWTRCETSRRHRVAYDTGRSVARERDRVSRYIFLVFQKTMQCLSLPRLKIHFIETHIQNCIFIDLFYFSHIIYLALFLRTLAWILWFLIFCLCEVLCVCFVFLKIFVFYYVFIYLFLWEKEREKPWWEYTVQKGPFHTNTKIKPKTNQTKTQGCSLHLFQQYPGATAIAGLTDWKWF